jgi:hypothetical protein
MRIPYVVGRWVRGASHYGRERLIEYLLHSPDSALWLVGTRRMGKTSALRQVEAKTLQTTEQYVPVLWDMQGCESPQDLSNELYDALLDTAERFALLQIDVKRFDGQDALYILRTLMRALQEHDKQLLLLIDEAEVLIRIAQLDRAWIGRLRRVLQDGRMRTIMTSTKLLAELNRLSKEWATSPFLFGFSLVNLTPLDEASARALVRQGQSAMPVEASDSIVDNIHIHTNGQPFLIQYLCHRLFYTDDAGVGRLRPIEEHDLAIDHVLAGFFQIDYQHLTQIERRLLLTVAELEIAKESELLVALSEIAPRRIQMHLYGMERLGYLRQIFGQWSIGNELLRQWVVENADELASQLASSLDDALHETMLEVGRRHEARFVRDEIVRLEAELTLLEAQVEDLAGDRLVDVLEQIDRLRRELERLRRLLESLQVDPST